MAYTTPTLLFPRLDNSKATLEKEKAAAMQEAAMQADQQRQMREALAARMMGNDKPEAPVAPGTFLFSPMKQMTPADFLNGESPFYTAAELREGENEQRQHRNQQRKQAQTSGAASQPHGGGYGHHGQEPRYQMAPDDGRRIGGKAKLNQRLDEWSEEKDKEFTSFFSKRPKLEGMAAGGTTTKPTIVGENGPELILPHQGGSVTVMPTQPVSQTATGGTVITPLGAVDYESSPGIAQWFNQGRAEERAAAAAPAPSAPGNKPIMPVNKTLTWPQPVAAAKMPYAPMPTAPMRTASKPPPFLGEDSSFYVAPETDGKPEGIPQSLWNQWLRSGNRLESEVRAGQEQKQWDRDQGAVNKRAAQDREDKEAAEEEESARQDAMAEAMTEAGNLLTATDVRLIRSAVGSKAKASMFEVLSKLRMQERAEKREAQTEAERRTQAEKDFKNWAPVPGTDYMMNPRGMTLPMPEAKAPMPTQEELDARYPGRYRVGVDAQGAPTIQEVAAAKAPRTPAVKEIRQPGGPGQPDRISYLQYNAETNTWGPMPMEGGAAPSRKPSAFTQKFAAPTR
jgi:hypothetical protein